MTLFDLSKPGAKAIRSSFGGGWIVALNDDGARVLAEYFGEGPAPIPLAASNAQSVVLGYIVEPQDAGDLAEYLRSEGVAWEIDQ
jgi:hypothetical protein